MASEHRFQEPDEAGSLVQTRDESLRAAGASLERPWLEQRKVPAVPGIPINRRIVAPGGFSDSRWHGRSFEHPTRYFNSIEVPYLPSAEYIQHFSVPEHRTAPPVERMDEEVYRLMVRALRGTGIDPEVWRNWALAAKIVNLDVLAANRRIQHGSPMIATEWREDERRYEFLGGVPRFFTKEELFAKRDGILSTVRERPMRDTEDAMKLWSVLAAARWGIDNEIGIYDLSVDELLALYSDLNYVMETTYPTSYRAEYGLFALHSSLARVAMGGREEQYYHNEAFPAHEVDQHFDEVDAIFHAAVHVLGEQGPHIARIQKGRSASAAGPERYCLFNGTGATEENFDHDRADPVGLILLMGAQYFRMDARLRKVWRPALVELFRRAQRGRDRWYPLGMVGVDEPTLTVLGTADDGLEHDKGRIISGTTRLMGTDEVRRKLEVVANGTKPRNAAVHTDQHLVGPGSDRVLQRVVTDVHIYQDSGGTEYTYTNRWLELTPLVQAEREVVERMPLKLTPVERLPKEAAALVSEIAHDPESGRMDKVGALKRIVERLTGRTIEDLDPVQTIATLGHLMKLGKEIPTLPRDQADAVLFEVQHGSRSFAEHDDITKLLIILRLTNRLPKELVVEQLIRALSGAVPISLLRICLEIERMERQERKDWDDPEHPFTFPAFTGRDELKHAREEFGAESPRFRRAAIETFMRFTGFLQAHHEYEATVTDFLSMLQVLEETGRPMSQCGELAHIIAEMQNWMSEGCDLPASRVAYRERFAALPLKDWLDQVRRGEGTFDHLKVWTPLPAKPGQERTLVVDETTGEGWLVHKTTSDDRRSKDAARGAYRLINEHAGNLDFAGRTVSRNPQSEGELVFDAKVKDRGVSLTMLGRIAAQYPELRRYAEALAPDEPVTLLNLVNFLGPRDEQFRHLSHVLRIAPRKVADGFGIPLRIHALELLHATELCVEHKAFPQALFLCHVLDAKGYIGDDSPSRGLRLRIFDALAPLPEAQFEETLRQGLSMEWIMEEDVVAVRDHRRRYHEELERLMRERQLKVDEAAQELKARREEALQKAVIDVRIGVVALSPDVVREGLGDRVSREIREDVANEAEQYQKEHELSLPPPPSVDEELLNQFVELNADGIPFALSELTRGLSPEDQRRALEAAGFVLIHAAGKYRYDQLPGGLDAVWERITEAANRSGLSFPSRAAVIERAKELHEHRDGDRKDPIAGLLTGLINEV